jgi:hypothetical protein
MTATRRYMRCILVLCLCHHGISTNDASDAQIMKQRAKTSADDKKLRAVTMRGQNSQPTGRELNKDGMTAKQIAKMKQVERKRMQMLVRKRKESIKQNKMRTNRGNLKPQYDWQANVNPPPMMGPILPPSNMGEGQYGPPPMDGPPPPPNMEAGQYGPPPPMNGDGLPPPMRPPPPMWEGTAGYGPPPPIDQPPPPPHDMKGPPPQMWKADGWKSYGSKSGKDHNNDSGNKLPIKPGYLPYGPFPPDNEFPPHFPPDRPFPPKPIPRPGRPTFFPAYSLQQPPYTPTSEPNNLYTVKITFEGLMNTYGLMPPTSREEYNAMVKVLEQTIMDTARAPLKNNQRIIQVKVFEIEGITPQSVDSFRQLQSVDGASFDGNSFQCAFVERKQCCAREPPQGAGNPAQYCESLGCSIDDCRRVRFDIVAEQLLEQGSNRKLQSITDPSTQRIVNELYTTITQYLIQQVNSGAFTNSLRANVRYCNSLCLKTMADVTVTGVVFGPPMDILIAIPTLAPTPFPTKNPSPRPTPFPTRNLSPRPTPRPIKTPRPTTQEPTLYPTLYPTRNPTLYPTGSLPVS